MKSEVWERWISITGGAGTAFPELRSLASNGTITTLPFIYLSRSPRTLLIFYKNLIQTVRVANMLDSTKILPKSSTLCVGCNNVTDRQVANDRWTAHAIGRM